MPIRPTTAKPSQDYEQGWNAINELIRADYTWSGYERNVFYANNRDGTFSDVSGAVDLDFLEDGRSFALADFDHDGRQEVFLKNRNAPQLRLLKNVAEDLPPSIAFRLRGIKSNPDAIGAAVTDRIARPRCCKPDRDFFRSTAKMCSSASGTAKGPVNASIRWPSGLVQQLHDLPINHRVWVEEGVAPSRIEPFKTSQPSPILNRKPPKLFRQPSKPGCSRPCPRRIFASTGQASSFLQLEFDPVRQAMTVSDDIAAVYNILYRYLFDRHRDLTLPTSFLIDAKGDIVKVYQGPVDPRGCRGRFQAHPSNHRTAPGPGASLPRQHRNL